MIRKLVVAIAVTFMYALPARATTITLGGTVVANEGLTSSVAGATVIGFNALSLGLQDYATGIASYTNVDIYSCNCGDLPNDTSNGARARSQDFTIDFSQSISYFGLYWGSPDPSNTITFFHGATQLFSFTGQNAQDQLGIAFGLDEAAYVNFTAGAGESYTRIVLSSAGHVQDPFETDNHAFVAAVPEPSSLLLFTTGGLGLITTWRRRKRSRS